MIDYYRRYSDGGGGGGGSNVVLSAKFDSLAKSSVTIGGSPVGGTADRVEG